jgi:hypothetical protein
MARSLVESACAALRIVTGHDVSGTRAGKLALPNWTPSMVATVSIATDADSAPRSRPALLKVAPGTADVRQRNLRSAAFVALRSNPAGSNGPPLHCHIAACSSWLGSEIVSRKSA